MNKLIECTNSIDVEYKSNYEILTINYDYFGEEYIIKLDTRGMYKKIKSGKTLCNWSMPDIQGNRQSLSINIPGCYAGGTRIPFTS